MKQMKARKTKEIDEINWIVFFRGRGLGPSHNPPQEQSTLCELRKRRKKEWIYWREGLLGCACLPCAEQWRVAPPLIHTKKTAQPFRSIAAVGSCWLLFFSCCGPSLPEKKATNPFSSLFLSLHWLDSIRFQLSSSINEGKRWCGVCLWAFSLSLRSTAAAAALNPQRKRPTTHHSASPPQEQQPNQPPIKRWPKVMPRLMVVGWAGLFPWAPRPQQMKSIQSSH